ncbi:MAG: DNA mismatch repair protein MutS [Actinomycetota bacterium]|nr:DNA mismatch repair protein MutS [Actinomycetota bacterium]
MKINSILFENNSGKKETFDAPDFFADLNLGQVIAAITAGKDEYNLKPFFYTPLNDVDSIEYRHEIFRDLESEILFENVKAFAQKMRVMRKHLEQSGKLHYKFQKERWFSDAVEIYCGAVNGLLRDLSSAHLKSRGLLSLRQYLADYAGSEPFTSLLKETKRLIAGLSSIKYRLLIDGDKVRVRQYESETDYGAHVEEIFKKFKQPAAKDYRMGFPEGSPDMNHVEARILDFVAMLNPGLFLDLDNYYLKNSGFLDETIRILDRELQFYISCLDFISIFKPAGLNFCYPRISGSDKDVYDYEGFDMALAHNLIKENLPVVCNDFFMKGEERVIVVTGPNQGGKTTFARTFGQLHYLAAIGCPVPGREARLFLFDRLFTHFEKGEDVQNLRGKLQDDLVRIYEILRQCTPNSIIVMNEIFTSTTLRDAVFLSERIMEKILELDLLCVWVTFIDELASFGGQTVSMVSTVAPENPTLRTFKVIRRPAEGLAHAILIAQQYRLTYDQLKERIKS